MVDMAGSSHHPNRWWPALPLLWVVLGAGSAMAADRPDMHLAGNPASALCQQSAFAHGFMHGYENGFRRGDGDYQMGRGAQDARSLPEYRDSASGYHSQFGNKEQFRRGYREGFLSGYGDSTHDRSFRAVAAARIAAADLKPDAAQRTAFDAGFADGYESLRPHAAAKASKSAPDCSLNSLEPGGLDSAYCEGFGHGRKFAFFAAPLEPPDEGVQTAAKR
jgi:hypothetical protein